MQVTRRKEEQRVPPYSPFKLLIAIKGGAMPKVIASDKESKCAPKALSA